MAILLIGSTGNGKSTLGNFLLDPENIREVFTMGKDNKPETQFVNRAKKKVKIIRRNQEETEETTETTGTGEARKETAGKETATKETARNETARKETARKETATAPASKETAGNETATATASKETATKETATAPASKETATAPATATATATAGKETATKETAGKKETKAKEVEITVIDTPGLNEGPKEDLRHMIGIIQELKNYAEVQACIFVIKFNSKIDVQYKETIQYYSMLLPHFFERNVVIVMTDFATDPRSIRKRERQKVDVQSVIYNTVREIVECAKLKYHPMVFTIDCLPDEEEMPINMEIRNALLEYVFTNDPMKVYTLQVAKTAAIRAKENNAIQQYEGEIKGYSLRLQEADKDAKEALRELEAKELEKTPVAADLKRLCYNLEDIDSDARVFAATWRVESEWRWFRMMSESFVLHSHGKILRVNKWNNGHSYWKNLRQEERIFSGTLEGSLMRGLYASVTVETSRRLQYADEIIKLKEEIDSTDKCMKVLEAESKKIHAKHTKHKKQLEFLAGFIAKKRYAITLLSNDYMTIEEATEKLKDI